MSPWFDTPRVHLSGDARLFRRGIGSIAAQTAPNGLTYGHAPTMAHNCILPDFTLIWLITLWDYYWQTGSLEPFLAHQDVIERALDYFARQMDSKIGMVGHDPRYWLFLDWTEIFKEGFPTVLNLWLFIALTKMASLHRLSGDPRKAKPLEEWSARLRSALRSLINKEGLLCDGRTFSGRIVQSTSVHSQTLAILAWKDIRFAPVFHGDEGGAAVPSPGGLIESHWKRRRGKIEVELSLPPGIRAQVELPGRKVQRTTGRKKWSLRPPEPEEER